MSDNKLTEDDCTCAGLVSCNYHYPPPKLMSDDNCMSPICNNQAVSIGYCQECLNVFDDIPKPPTVTISRECEWALDDPDYTCYNSQCGQTFVLNDGDLDSNGFNFCYSCGGKIKENAMEVSNA